MTRHELKDGKWYLIKSNGGLDLRKNESNSEILSMKPYLAECNREAVNESNCEWVEIEPELVFNLFKDQVKMYESLSGVSSCARGPVE